MEENNIMPEENNSEVVEMNDSIPEESINNSFYGELPFPTTDPEPKDDPTNIPYKSLLAPATNIIINGDLASIKDIFHYDSNAKVIWHDTYGYDVKGIMMPAEVECHRVIDLALNNVDKIISMSFSNGLDLLCAKSTPIADKDKNWVCAMDLKVGDQVICVDYNDETGITESTVSVTSTEEIPVISDATRRMVMYEFTSTLRNILIPKLQDNNTISFIVISQ